MRKAVFLVMILVCGLTSLSCTENQGANKVMKEGVIGAGAGAVGGAIGGGGNAIWQGALAGAGVSIIGNAIFDAMSGEKVDDTEHVKKLDSQGAYKEGYSDGYKQGYEQAKRELAGVKTK